MFVTIIFWLFQASEALHGRIPSFDGVWWHCMSPKTGGFTCDNYGKPSVFSSSESYSTISSMLIQQSRSIVLIRRLFLLSVSDVQFAAIYRKALWLGPHFLMLSRENYSAYSKRFYFAYISLQKLLRQPQENLCFNYRLGCCSLGEILKIQKSVITYSALYFFAPFDY